jgi:sensor c-di-GMP phosphodiesterase-like protein
LSVIAEGVETREQSDWLRSVGCPYQQGWCFARAMPIEELIARRPAEAIDATAVPSGAG